MNTKLTTLCAALLLATTAWLAAGESAPQAPIPKPASAEFERMKALVGTWAGKPDMGQGPVDMTIQYRLIANGTVLEERVAAGAPMEMVTMYYDKAGKLAMTHYCVMGNRPEMALKSSDAKSITFDLDAACCAFDPKKESHMSGVTIVFTDADTISSSCKATIEGQQVPEHSTVWKRVKTAPTAAK
jgi:hypothetical protein